MNLDEWVEQARSVSIISLFSTFVYLKKFFSQDAIERLRQTGSRKKSNLDSTEGVLNGLKLATVVALDGYAQEVVDAPDLLGVKPDYDYYDYTHFTKSPGRSITRSATRSDHTISKFVDKANTLLFRVIGINNWEFIDIYSNEVVSFADTLRNIFLTCYLAKDSNGNQIEAELALNVDSIGHVITEYTNIMPLLHLYTNYYHDFNSKIIPHYDETFDMRDYKTRFDHMHLVSELIPKHVPDSWAVGYASTIHETMKSLVTNKESLDKLVDLDKSVQEIEDWAEFEQYSKELDQVIGPPAFFGLYKYALRQIPSSNMVKDLLGEPKVRISPERMLSVLGNRARIVDSGSSSAAHLNFICLLDGAIIRSKKTNERVRLAIFIHKLDGERENYSFGLFMPAYGKYGLANASMWWIFYYVGNNHSGTASRQWNEVWHEISRNKKYIELIYVEADEDEFLKYCEDPGYIRLDTEIRCVDQMVGRLRGTYPELLLANMLTNKGFYPVRLRIKPSLLSGRKDTSGDLDVVGFKIKQDTCEIAVFESKGSARTDIELDNELIKFSNAVKLLADNPDKFCKEFRISFKGKYLISAYFVSMASMPNTEVSKGNVQDNIPPFLQIGHYPNVPKNVTFWDFTRFLKELEQSGVPDIYLALLKQMPVAITL